MNLLGEVDGSWKKKGFRFRNLLSLCLVFSLKNSRPCQQSAYFEQGTKNALDSRGFKNDTAQES